MSSFERYSTIVKHRWCSRRTLQSCSVERQQVLLSTAMVRSSQHQSLEDVCDSIDYLCGPYSCSSREKISSEKVTLTILSQNLKCRIFSPSPIISVWSNQVIKLRSSRLDIDVGLPDHSAENQSNNVKLEQILWRPCELLLRYDNIIQWTIFT